MLVMKDLQQVQLLSQHGTIGATDIGKERRRLREKHRGGTFETKSGGGFQALWGLLLVRGLGFVGPQ